MGFPLFFFFPEVIRVLFKTCLNKLCKTYETLKQLWNPSDEKNKNIGNKNRKKPLNNSMKTKHKIQEFLENIETKKTLWESFKGVYSSFSNKI